MPAGENPPVDTDCAIRILRSLIESPSFTAQIICIRAELPEQDLTILAPEA